MFIILKLAILNSGFSTKVTCYISTAGNPVIETTKTTLLNLKETIISVTILIGKWFQGYIYKSGIAIFAWKDTSNYAYSPFKITAL